MPVDKELSLYFLGKLTSIADLDPEGAALNFLLAGSPCIVSNLWDVTDKEIDKVSHTLLRYAVVHPCVCVSVCAPTHMCIDTLTHPLPGLSSAIPITILFTVDWYIIAL